MNLMTCLYQLQGYGIKFVHRQGRLVIQSTTYALTEAQTTCLKAHKPLLLALLPIDITHNTSTLLEAVETYLEREAIMLESAETLELAQFIALQQAQAVLNHPQ